MILDQDPVVVRLGSCATCSAISSRSGESMLPACVPTGSPGTLWNASLLNSSQFAVSINPHVAAAVSGSVPGTYRESFFAAADAGFIPADLAERLAPSAGLRNVLTHEYVEVDLGLVAAAVQTAVVDYRA